MERLKAFSIEKFTLDGTTTASDFGLALFSVFNKV